MPNIPIDSFAKTSVFKMKKKKVLDVVSHILIKNSCFIKTHINIYKNVKNVNVFFV